MVRIISNSYTEKQMNRFDFEQKIMDCWYVVDDIDTIYRYVINDVPHGKLDTDQIANLMLGMKQLYEIKFRQMFDTFEGLVHQGEI